MAPRLPMGPGGEGKVFTRAEVGVHCKPKDMWIIVDDKVYDVTTWAGDHPGGLDILLTQAGRDASDLFFNFHHTDSYELLPNYLIGEIAQEERFGKRKGKDAKKDAILQDYRRLTEECRRMGLFDSSKLYYSWKVFTHFAMLATFAALVINFPTSFLAVTLSALVAAVFYSQNGWLSHDFLHHQVFDNRIFGNWVGFMLGGLFQGFSLAWWKNKHNTHHASSNELDNDPDIDSIPFLSFHPVLLRGGQVIKESAAARFLLPIQVFTFVPIIMLARVNWCIRSIMWVVDKDIPIFFGRNLELAGLIAHWVCKFYLMTYMSVGMATWWFVVSEAIGGALIGLFFVLNHNGMDVFREAEFREMDFVTLQVLTSRDVISTFFSDFMSGGLNYQIEHHLFPTMPRHNFHKVAPLVDKLCAKHGIPIHRVHLMDGFKEFFSSLTVSQDCIKTNEYAVPPADIKHYS